MKKEVKRIGKNEEKLTKKYYNLLIGQNLWQAIHQIQPVHFLKKFTKLNIHADTTMKTIKLAELNISIATVFLNMQIVKMIYQNNSVYDVTKIDSKSLMKC